MQQSITLKISLFFLLDETEVIPLGQTFYISQRELKVSKFLEKFQRLSWINKINVIADILK